MIALPSASDGEIVRPTDQSIRKAVSLWPSGAADDGLGLDAGSDRPVVPLQAVVIYDLLATVDQVGPARHLPENAAPELVADGDAPRPRAQDERVAVDHVITVRVLAEAKVDVLPATVGVAVVHRHGGDNGHPVPVGQGKVRCRAGAQLGDLDAIGRRINGAGCGRQQEQKSEHAWACACDAVATPQLRPHTYTRTPMIAP